MPARIKLEVVELGKDSTIEVRYADIEAGKLKYIVAKLKKGQVFHVTAYKGDVVVLRKIKDKKCGAE